MTSALRRAGVIPALQLAVDGSTYAALRALGVPVVRADAVAVATGSVAEYLLARATRSDDPFMAHVDSRRATGGMFAATLVADVALLAAIDHVTRGRSPVAAKVVSTSVATLARFGAQRVLLAQELRRRAASKPTSPLPAAPVRLSVVIPAFAEADRIGDTVRTLRTGLADVARDGGLELVVVDDGSPDATAAAAREAGADQVVVHATNRGKGAAVRTGMLNARGAVLAFVDADLSYGPDEVRRLLTAVEEGADLAVGNRRHAASRSEGGRSATRRVGSVVFNLLTRPLLVGDYADTQCGVKAFRADVARRIFGRTRVDGFAFDVEVFHLAERHGFRLVEVPVTVHQSVTSTVEVLPTAVRVVRDVARIRRWSGMGLYDESVETRHAGARS